MSLKLLISFGQRNRPRINMARTAILAPFPPSEILRLAPPNFRPQKGAS
jgi:hypothetical protein